MNAAHRAYLDASNAADLLYYAACAAADRDDANAAIVAQRAYVDACAVRDRAAAVSRAERKNTAP